MIVISKETRKVILVMIVLVIIGITVAAIYYRDVNNSEDTRVVHAKTMLQSYEQVAATENYSDALLILDSIQWIYDEVDHYSRSYEIGVLHNNRSAIYLTIALYHNLDSLTQFSNFELSENHANESIKIYTNWLNEFDSLSEDQISKKLQSEHFTKNISVKEKLKTKILKKRVKDIMEAQLETKRRLSVSYTNLGIVKRHNNQVIDAANCYQKALELWNRNLSAKNNLNILQEKPLEKLRFIDKMFPPKKTE